MKEVKIWEYTYGLVDWVLTYRELKTLLPIIKKHEAQEIDELELWEKLFYALCKTIDTKVVNEKEKEEHYLSFPIWEDFTKLNETLAVSLWALLETSALDQKKKKK